ncbi:MAG: YidH family protein [Geminicoccales bacterium]
MIPSYSDHAANERTFLAWIRTGLTIMALGFVIERLDLFLASLGPAQNSAQAMVGAPEIHGLSVSLVSLAIVLIVAAGYRFVDINRAIEDQAVHPFKATLMPLGMALVLVAVGILLLLYLLHLI